MDESDLIVSSVTIIKDKLYFATLQGDYIPKSTKNSKYYHIEEDIVYESFFADYGPYHLSHLYLFCVRLNSKLAKLPKTKKLVFYTSDDKIQRLNAAYLIGSYMIIYLKKLPAHTAVFLTEHGYDLLSYRDASSGYPLFEIPLCEVFSGLHKAFHQGFFNFNNFNYLDYMYYEKVVHGDLNWIIPGKMLAFSGPHSQSRYLDDYPVHSPESYHEYFKNNNVTAIVRLNHKSYDAKQFTDYGFEHHELFFLDGSVPTLAIVDKFLKLSENTKGAVAVHCKAGLGRTGTLIACYMMKHHDFSARQAISWLRICRPGSVIGYQQKFLMGIQTRMASEGKKHRAKYNITKIPKFKYGVYATLSKDEEDEDLENGNFAKIDVNKSNLDDLENVPTVTPTVCKKDSEIIPNTKKNEDYVNLNSIIIPKHFDNVSTRSTAKTRASTALENAKNTYTANKNNYIVSANGGVKLSSSVKTAQTKVQSSTSSVKTSGFVVSQNGSVKMSFAKSQYAKGSIHTQRANLARNHGQGYSLSAGPLKTYSRKIPSNAKTSLTQDNLKKSTSMDKYDANLNPPSKSVADSVVDGSRKKMILRKKTPKSSMEQIKDFKNCNISNSDSERDSTNTTATNISADSLENIPCKMATRRDKSRSPEPPMYPLGESINNGVGDMDEGVDSQGTKLCHIKATRKKSVGFENSVGQKEGAKTRNYTGLSLAKKK